MLSFEKTSPLLPLSASLFKSLSSLCLCLLFCIFEGHVSVDIKPLRIIQDLCSMLDWLYYTTQESKSSLSWSDKVAIRMNRTCALQEQWEAQKSVFSASLCPCLFMPSYHHTTYILKGTACYKVPPALCFERFVKVQLIVENSGCLVT